MNSWVTFLRQAGTGELVTILPQCADIYGRRVWVCCTSLCSRPYYGPRITTKAQTKFSDRDNFE